MIFRISRLFGAAAFAVLVSACGNPGFPRGGFGCGACVPPPAMFAGTPIPTQPIPGSAGVTGLFNVTVAVVVANGNITSASISTSSGNTAIDQAGLMIARSSSARKG